MKRKYRLGWNPDIPPMPKLKFKKSKPRLMIASNEFHPNEFAQWERFDGLWRVTQMTEHLRWMKGMEPAQAKLELAKRGFSWRWNNSENTP